MELLKGITVNKWNDFENGSAKVFYLQSNKLKTIKALIDEVNPDKIIVNGIYSIPFAWYPAWLYPKKTIMHIRGMLHPGALGQKALKKRLFLLLIGLTGITKKIQFWVSDEAEAQFTRKQFPASQKIWVVPNLPASFKTSEVLPKAPNKLMLCSIALISPMKNHLLVVKALTELQIEIGAQLTYHIYGPVKDQKYWMECLIEMNRIKERIEVKYMGEIEPTHIESTLEKYHAFILPSQSENFGHAIFEALQKGKPVIISKNTPWNNLNEKNAGYNVDLNTLSITEAIINLLSLDNVEYSAKCKSARKYAEKAIDIERIKTAHYEMLNTA